LLQFDISTIIEIYYKPAKMCETSRMNRRLVIAAAAALGLTPHTWAAAQSRAATGPATSRMRLVTTHLPPLVLEHGGTRPGALTELVVELCKRMQLAPQTQFVPWRRATFLATTMPATAIYPLTRLPEREAQYRWLAPLYDEHYVFLALRKGPFDVHSPQQMKTRRIAMLRGAGQAAVLRELGYSNLVEAASIDEVHRFLLTGIAEASFGERNIIRTSLRNRGEEANFELSAPLRSTTAWLAGSLDFTQDEVQQFQRATAAMAADGSSRRILARYGLD
jgi:ABC-type amino acid transport substrate-binding protein